MSRIQDSIEIFDESAGLVIEGRCLVGELPTTAGLFAVGADIILGDTHYINTGTSAAPVWTSEAGIATPPAGVDTQIQFNDADALAGGNLTWDKTNNVLTVGQENGAGPDSVITAPDAVSADTDGQWIALQGGTGNGTGNGGSVDITGGNGGVGGIGGDVSLTPGASAGLYLNGQPKMPNLPTSSSGLVAGDLYNSSGTIKIKI